MAFLLNAALRSMAGGNVAAARQRFGLCKQELVAQAEAQGHTPELCCQLGDVCGSQVGGRGECSGFSVQLCSANVAIHYGWGATGTSAADILPDCAESSSVC